MNRKNLFVLTSIAGVGLAVVLGSIAFAEPAKDDKPAKQPEMQLPPGMTEEDMKAFTEAATPGKMHRLLADGAGEWTAKCTAWMAPDTDPTTSEGSAKGTMIMGGRFLQLEFKSEMMGEAFTGLGLYGYDNVAKKFSSTWIDNMGTAMLQGTGGLSEDGKVLTWKYTYHCPIAKKLVTMREVETMAGPNSRKLEMYGPEPKSGKEYKMMVIELTRAKEAPAKN